MREIDLLPNGHHLHLNNDNKAIFVLLASRRRVTNLANDEMKLLRRGLLHVFPKRYLSIFTPQEVGR